MSCTRFGEVSLTELGRRISDASQEAAARVDAFLNVPLYLRIYDNYKGYTLPQPAALEKFMRDVGVSSKQTGKARHAFARSAKQAGFFAHGEDRLVRPAMPAGPGTKPIEELKKEADASNDDSRKNGGGGTGELELDPLLIALLKKVPSAEKGWPMPARVRWFRTFAMNVSQIYDAEGEGDPAEMKIELEKEAAN